MTNTQEKIVQHCHIFQQREREKKQKENEKLGRQGKNEVKKISFPRGRKKE